MVPPLKTAAEQKRPIGIPRRVLTNPLLFFLKGKKTHQEEQDEDSGSEYSFSDEASVKEVPRPKIKKESSPKRDKKKDSKPAPEKETPKKAEEEEAAYLSDYDEDWRFTDPNMAVLRFQSRTMPKAMAYTAVKRPKGTAAVALANAIDDNLWFPTSSEQNTPGGNLFAYWQLKTSKYHTLAHDQSNLLQLFHNKVNTLIRPMYCFRQMKEPEFDLLKISVTTPVAVILPNQGDCKFNGFAVCGNWLYSTKNESTVAVTQKSLFDVGYLTIANPDGSEVRSSRSKKVAADLMQTADRLDTTVDYLASVVTWFRKFCPIIYPPGVAPAKKPTVNQIDTLLQQGHESETESTEKGDDDHSEPTGNTKISAEDDDVDDVAMTEAIDENAADNKANQKPAASSTTQKPATIPVDQKRSSAHAIEYQDEVHPFDQAHPWNIAPDEDAPKIVGIDRGEIPLLQGQELRPIKHVKYYAVMPHKENVTKIHEKAEKVEATRNAPLTQAPHHPSTDGGHITHHSRR